MTQATFPQTGTRANITARDARRRLPGDSAMSPPRGDLATWLVAGAATAGVVAAAVSRPTRRRVAASVGGTVNL